MVVRRAALPARPPGRPALPRPDSLVPFGGARPSGRRPKATAMGALLLALATRREAAGAWLRSLMVAAVVGLVVWTPSALAAGSPPSMISGPRSPETPAMEIRSRLRRAPGPALSPISYAYQWRSCDVDGGNCANITGATALTYVLTLAELRKTRPHPGHGDECVWQRRHPFVELEHRRLGADQHRAAGPLRYCSPGGDDGRGEGIVGRHRADRLRLPVATLRRRRLELCGHRRRHAFDVHSRPRGRPTGPDSRGRDEHVRRRRGRSWNSAIVASPPTDSAFARSAIARLVAR